MVLDTLDDFWHASGDHFEWHAPHGWMQGRAIFGGLVAAAAVNLAKTQTKRALRSMQARLFGPLVPGPVEGRVQVIRKGKTVTFIDVELRQGDALRSAFSFVFVMPRENSVEVSPPPVPQWDAAGDVFPYIENLVPEFTQHLSFRMIEGGFPFSHAAEARFSGSIAFKKPPTTWLAEHQLLLLDAWPCPTLSVLRAPAFASTVQWSAHLLAPSSPGEHRFTYQTIGAHGGFSTTVGHMWDASGTYTGFTEQTVVVFD